MPTWPHSTRAGRRVDGVEDFNPNRDTRNIRMEDGILLPRYRLPTEAEWEYAAYRPDRKLRGRADRGASHLPVERTLGALRQPQERRCLLR